MTPEPSIELDELTTDDATGTPLFDRDELEDITHKVAERDEESA